MSENDSKQINWMYEGKNSSIDHEQYLLGRRITTVGEDDDDKGDFLVKPESSIATGNVTVLERLDYESKVREDPLFHIRKNDYQHRKELLSNPLKKKRIQNMLKQALVKDLSRKGIHGSHSESSSSSGDTDSSSSSEDERRRKHKSKKRSANKERKDSSDAKDRFSKSYGTGKREHSNHGQSKEKVTHKQHSRQTSGHRSSNRKYSGGSPESSTLKNDEVDRLKKSGYGLMCLQDGKHVSTTVQRRKRRERSPSPEKPKQKYQRTNRSGFSSGLSKEELEKKRMEMMNNASWRDNQRKGNVKKFQMEDAREDEEEKRKQMSRHKDKYGHSRDFLHDMKLKSASSGSVEDTVRRKKHTLSRKF